MVRRAAALFLWVSLGVFAAVPEPLEHFGFTPGDDYKLADYTQITGYFKKLEASSDRIRFVEFGKTSNGKPMYIAFLSDAGNLRQLDQYREISRRLALGQAEPAEARRLAAQGKAIVWIDSGLHASEVAPAQHAPLLAYRMITSDSEEVRRIRQNVILLQVPVINPDGLDMIVNWYRQNLGTLHELSPLPGLYQKYAGHDNNRDYFMLNLEETRNVSRLLFREWFPQIVYNQHQAPAFPARIFVPPYAEPLNPHIPAPVMEGINLIGSAMKERFARENKPGVLSYFGFDGWWNGGLRSVPAFHNMHGILTETAASGYATPKNYQPRDLPERFGNGIPTREPTIFYQRPWLGGNWDLRDAIEYMLTADFAILDLAAGRSEHFLYKAWELARANIELGKKGKPYAYLVPPEQWDSSAAYEMLHRLSLGGVEIHRASAPFQANGRTWPEGTHVLPAGQPFRAYLMDLMEPQKYPEIRTGITGPTKRPYDIAGWTLSMQMGVEVERADEPFRAELERVTKLRPPEPSLNPRENSSFLTVAALLDHGAKVRRAADGKFLPEGQAPAQDFAGGAWELNSPRVALYNSWTGNMDAGWTQWVLDNYKVPYTLVHNDDVRGGELSRRFDSLILPAQSPVSILHGTRAGVPPSTTARGGDEETGAKSLQRPEYTGGIGIEGLSQLEGFVREGGTLIAFDSAADLILQFFPVGVKGLLRTSGDSEPDSKSSYYCPGSLLRITVDNSHPLAFGMPPEAIAISTGGQAFEIPLLPSFNKGEREVKSVARYAASNLLASGWVSGEKAVLGKHILVEARLGKGKVILFGFRPQFRGQPHGTFKLLLNALYQASAKPLP